MTALRTWRPVCALLLVFAIVVGLPASAYQRPSRTERVSFNPDGSQRSSDSTTYGSGDDFSISSNGRYVAYVAVGSVVNAGVVSAGSEDVYLYDRKTHKTTLVSAAVDGGVRIPAPGCSRGAYEPAVSDDGRYVAFTSCYVNLTSGPPAGFWPQVEIRDLRAKKTFLVSQTPAGQPVAANRPTISADGRRVSFVSASPLPFPGCSGDSVQTLYCQNVQPLLFGTARAYVRDLKAATTKLASVSSDGTPANGYAADATISPDGRYVAFLTTANNLASNDQNVQCAASLNAQQLPTCPDLYLHDMKSGDTELISVGLNGKAASAEPGFRGQMISANNRYVAFQSTGSGIVPNGGAGIFVRDRKTGRSERVAVSAAGEILPYGDGFWSIDSSGRYVAFDDVRLRESTLSEPCNLFVSAVHDSRTGGLDLIGATDVHGRTRSCTMSQHGSTGNDHVSGPKVSVNGRYVAFATAASELVQGDTNDKADVFVQDRGVELGVGALVRSGQLRVANAGAFAATGVADGHDAKRDVGSALSAQGANLTDLSIAYRQATSDLFFRLRVEHMPLFALVSPAMVYRVDFAVGATRYELRAAKTGIEASFGLFRLDVGQWRHVAALAGGYGTTGQEVVMSVPLATLGAVHGAVVSRVTGFAGIGTFATGVRNAVDQCLLAGGSS